MSIITLWLRALFMVMLSDIFPVNVSSVTVSVPESHVALCSLCESINAVIVRFICWPYASFFLQHIGYFDTS